MSVKRTLIDELSFALAALRSSDLNNERELVGATACGLAKGVKASGRRTANAMADL
jgi:hypothetical protein